MEFLMNPLYNTYMSFILFISIYVYKGRAYVWSCLFLMPSLLNGLSDRNMDYTIKIVRAQGLVLSYLKVHSDWCVFLLMKKHLVKLNLSKTFTNNN